LNKVALILSFIYCGFGQLYKREIMKGIDFIVIYTFLIVFFFFFPTSPLLHFIVLFAIILLWLLGMVEVYDINTDSWETKLNMPSARCFLTSGVINNQIFVIGGSSAWPNAWPNDFSPANEVYTPDPIDTKSVEPSGKLMKTWGMLKAK